MSGTRGGLGRIVAMGVALALALLLLGASEATAGKYAVAQCGWYRRCRRRLGRHNRRRQVPLRLPTACRPPARTRSTAPI